MTPSGGGVDGDRLRGGHPRWAPPACGLRSAHILVSLGVIPWAIVPLGEESVARVLPRALPLGGLSWLRGGVGCLASAFRAWGPFPGWRSNRHPPQALWASVSLSLVASSPLSVCSSHVRPLRPVLFFSNTGVSCAYIGFQLPTQKCAGAFGKRLPALAPRRVDPRERGQQKLC